MTELGRLEQVDIRDVFGSEPAGFTPWLCTQDGLDLLSKALQFELEVIQREHPVGTYSLDILARRKGTDEMVVIENQYWQTDHKHLGQLLTYAAGVGADGSGAKTIVWVATSFAEPHRAALDWLNKCTDPGIQFFGVEFQLLKIGDSAPAPWFKVVSKPNAWQKQLTQETAQFSETHETYREFWTDFIGYCGENTTLQFDSPQPRHWLSTDIGRSGFGVNLTASRRLKKLECQLWIHARNAKSAYRMLLADRAIITERLGSQVQFDEMPTKGPSKIFEVSPGDVGDRDQWPNIHKWLKERGELYAEVFRPLVKRLNLD